jgi:hypothetical protein
MRTFLTLTAFLLLMPAAARAMTIDAKALARFDVSYAKCEGQSPAMRGHRDEAYLSMWRVKLDDKGRAQLAAVRKSPDYQAERRRALRPAQKSASSAAASPLEQQCQALWAETQRGTQVKQ